MCTTSQFQFYIENYLFNYFFFRSGTEEKLTELNLCYRRDFASVQDGKRRRKWITIRKEKKCAEQLYMMSMLQYHSALSVISKVICYCHAGRISSPTTSLVDLDADEVESNEESLGSMNTENELANGMTTLFTSLLNFTNYFRYRRKQNSDNSRISARSSEVNLLSRNKNLR